MPTRKELKTRGRRALKRHYAIFLLLCLVPAILGGELTVFSNVSARAEGSQSPQVEATMVPPDVSVSVPPAGDQENRVTLLSALVNAFVEFTVDLALGQEAQREEAIRQAEEGYVAASQVDREAILGRSDGVLAMLVNKVSSGAYLVTLTMGIRALVGNDSAVVVILLLLAMALVLLVEIFVLGVYRAVILRMFLEGRCYEKLPAHRVWFLMRVKRWCHVGVTQLVVNLFTALWSLTIVGGAIKYYSYYLVPFLMAENPDLGTLEAITLSRRLMHGHKWECFWMELSFLGWVLLGALTAGVVNSLYTVPYMTAVQTEYYVELRRLGKERQVEHSARLNDRYLFQKAEPEELSRRYGDVRQAKAQSAAEMITPLKGIHKFLADNFGVTIRRSRELECLEAAQNRAAQLDYDIQALEGLVYPTRLHPIPEKRKRKWMGNLNYIRYYSVWSLVLMFFSLSFVGWLWEVSLHLLTDGVFVNRGVLHGPWLPIYGWGSVLILLVLNRFRKRPGLEFLSAVVLCGCVEYFTSLGLELMHGGTRWWDYTGYFLNLNGRICAEGLLVFGVAGMAVVYVLAPLLDGALRKLPAKAITAAALVLLGIFVADQVYSSIQPNTGAGITDYEASAAVMEELPQ